ncbi:terminase large subunit domain-containing protein [Actinobacillus equuli]|uniref:terminase large subunit domain-containing protein n=1 Tax=Actinobacillus equuli TaxID=718 RepID=UPI0024412F8C|nr:terminase family protein [Actinobacillus equuli]WGE76357.1 terminase family protein [Actinobacillus equuli subsp. haemolyticus]WGE78282.1 terminase family protein [Actinobacillus equuli subsp. haemolyticus]
MNVADKRRKAQMMYWAGYIVTEISRQIDVPVSTIASRKNRGKWDDVSPVGRVEATVEARLNLLILKENKSNNDYKEIDALRRLMESTARVKKYSNGGGNEADLNPKLKNRNKGERKPAEQNAISEEQAELLINGFLSGMFQYQRTWHEAGQKYRVRNILKSRQIGATYYFAHEALIDALVTGRNQIFISASKKQALQFRAYIVQYALDKAEVALKGETITLPNGAQLIFLGTNSKTAQSYHGNLYFDEIFWVNGFEELRKVTSGMAAQKQYRITYFSTPTGVTHQAYRLWSGKAFNSKRPKSEQVEIDISHANLKSGKLCGDGIWRQIVNIYDAEAGGCNLFDIEQLKLENSPDDFNQLYMCEFMDENTGVFKFAMIQRCCVDSMEVWKDYNFTMGYARPYGNREVWLGYDPSYSGDRSALVVIAPPKADGLDFRLLEYKTYKGADFQEQAQEILAMCERYNVTKISIDNTGLGVGVSEIVCKHRPDAQLLQYSAELKSKMVLKGLDVINKGRFKFDSLHATEVGASFMAIKKQLTNSQKQITYVADRSEEASHADLAWACLQVLLNESFDGTLSDNTGTMEFYD